MNLRKITSLTLLISFVLLILSSTVLYIIPHGRVAYWADWRLWGLSKTQWGNLHINLGLLFLLAGLVHMFYNWKPIISYVKNRAKKPGIFSPALGISLLLTLAVGAGTLLNIPPMSTVIELGESIKDRASKKYGEPPYGHAELTSLKKFAQQTELDLYQAKKLLASAGITCSGDEQTLLEISKANNISPKAVADVMQPARKQLEPGTPFPETAPAGFGRKTLTEICTMYHLDISDIIKKLFHASITATPDQSIKEIAAENKTNPYALFEVLQNVAQ